MSIRARPLPQIPQIYPSGSGLSPLGSTSQSAEDQHSKVEDPLPPVPSLQSPVVQRGRLVQLLAVLRTIWVVAGLPFLAFPYLVFCFVVDHKIIKVSIWKIDDPVSRITIIKAGVTSISILITTLALIPLKTLIGDLQSEEFFRILMLKRDGVPLSVINQVSIPSYGFLDKLLAILRKKSSSVYTGAFVAGLTALVVSTLAPATLSVQIAQMDDELRAFRVGAVFRRSVWNATKTGVVVADNVGPRAQYAAGLPWVENGFGVTYKWKMPKDDEDGSIYAIPTLLDVPVNSPVRYVTDLVKIKPECKWHAPDLSGITGANSLTAVTEYALIPELGWRFAMSDLHFAFQGDLQFSNLNTSPGASEINSLKDAEGSSLTDGSAAWYLIKCIPGGAVQCDRDTNVGKFGNLVMNNIPTTTYAASINNQTFAVSLLICRPNGSVETREIRTDMDGLMTVEGSGRVLTRQNNIHRLQARVLMSQSIGGVGNNLQYTGPNPHSDYGMYGLGGAAQLQLLFGNEVAAKTPDDLQFVIQSPEEITKIYGKMLQGTLKVFLDGTLAQAHVPGRTFRNVVIFTTSRPHLYTSTVVFVVLALFIIVAHFRSPVPQFTFFDIASSLSKSTVPGIFADIKNRDGLLASERLADGELRDRPIVLEGRPGLSAVNIRFQ